MTDSRDRFDLMAIVPHPDDEAFSLGGAWQRVAQRGGRSALLTLTHGRGGRSLGLCPPEQLGHVRRAELVAAAEVFQIHDVVVWDHHDFVPDGDRGVPRHAGLSDLSVDDLAAAIADEIRRRTPRAVVTFPANGSNGHPDHVATHVAVHRALRLLDRTGEGPSSNGPRVFHFAPPRPYDGPARDGFLDAGAIARMHVGPSHQLILTRDEIATKLAGIARHTTQALSITRYLERLSSRIGTETFVEVDVHGRPVRTSDDVATIDSLA